MKPEIVSPVHKALNKLDHNLHFTVDTFQNEVTYFLDLELSPDRIKIFLKTQILAYMLISQALSLGYILLHGLGAL